jgi:DNA-binding PadR family transcriptional regulator
MIDVKPNLPNLEDKGMPRRHVQRDLRLSALEEDILTLLVGRHLCAQELLALFTQASEDGASVAQSTPYSVLPRMEEKGLVFSTWSTPTDGSAGASRRRYYDLSDAGLRTLQERRRFRARLETLSTPVAHLLRRQALNRCVTLR